MKATTLFFTLLIGLSACRPSGKEADGSGETTPCTAVTLTRPVVGSIPRHIVLSATTVYQSKGIIAAPVAAFVTEVLVSPGSLTEAGQVVCYLESKEQHALSSPHAGKIPVRAGVKGIVMEVACQKGGFVAEGATLCTTAEAGSMAFELHVPYEQFRYLSPDRPCTLELPDGTRLQALLSHPLATMDESLQSVRMVAHAASPLLPEGMRVKALLPVREKSESRWMLLPKEAVQSNEQLTEHWVMKLADDNTARRIAVETGHSNADSIEVKAATLSPADRIILTGGHSLPEGSRVRIAQIDDTTHTLRP